MTAKDLPLPGNHIHSRDGQVHLDLAETNMDGLKRLKHTLKGPCGGLDIHPQLFEPSLCLGRDTPIGGIAHRAGTMRFGADPASPVLDVDCKAHKLDNLYVTDASFFPSIGAVNPTQTTVANALRVAGTVAARLR